MKQGNQYCGFCKSEKGKIFPVSVKSRGKTFKSWSHLKCMLRWNKVSVVTIDHEMPEYSEFSQDAEARLQHYRKRSIVSTLLRREKIAKKCVDCGYPIHPNSERCLECAGKHRAELYPKQVNRCVNCGQEIVNQATRCPTCSAIYREKVKYDSRHNRV
jgi:hypothetical protein